jgi:hypothetical protein
MKRLSWKYLAGLIDGEGCIDIQVTKQIYVRPRLRIAQTENCKFVLEMARNSWGGYFHERPAKGNHRASVSWELSGYKQSCPVLRNVINHLFVKKEQARFALWMERNLKGQQVSTEVRDAVREEFKLMKRDPHRLSEKAQERILGML